MTPQKLFRRYRSGYRAGRMINGLGILSKLIGLILAFALADLGFQAAKLVEQYRPIALWIRDNLQLQVGDQQLILLGTGVVLGLIILFLFWLAGTFVSAVGQILKAILDTAVNTSPFLTPDDKQAIIP